MREGLSKLDTDSTWVFLGFFVRQGPHGLAVSTCRSSYNVDQSDAGDVHTAFTRQILIRIQQPYPIGYRPRCCMALIDIN